MQAEVKSVAGCAFLSRASEPAGCSRLVARSTRQDSYMNNVVCFDLLIMKY